MNYNETDENQPENETSIENSEINEDNAEISDEDIFSESSFPVTKENRDVLPDIKEVDVKTSPETNTNLVVALDSDLYVSMLVSGSPYNLRPIKPVCYKPPPRVLTPEQFEAKYPDIYHKVLQDQENLNNRLKRQAQRRLSFSLKSENYPEEPRDKKTRLDFDETNIEKNEINLEKENIEEIKRNTEKDAAEDSNSEKENSSSDEEIKMSRKGKTGSKDTTTKFIKNSYGKIIKKIKSGIRIENTKKLKTGVKKLKNESEDTSINGMEFVSEAAGSKNIKIKAGDEIKSDPGEIHSSEKKTKIEEKSTKKVKNKSEANKEKVKFNSKETRIEENAINPEENKTNLGAPEIRNINEGTTKKIKIKPKGGKSKKNETNSGQPSIKKIETDSEETGSSKTVAVLGKRSIKKIKDKSGAVISKKRKTSLKEANPKKITSKSERSSTKKVKFDSEKIVPKKIKTDSRKRSSEKLETNPGATSCKKVYLGESICDKIKADSEEMIHEEIETNSGATNSKNNKIGAEQRSSDKIKTNPPVVGSTKTNSEKMKTSSGETDSEKNKTDLEDISCIKSASEGVLLKKVKIALEEVNLEQIKNKFKNTFVRKLNFDLGETSTKKNETDLIEPNTASLEKDKKIKVKLKKVTAKNVVKTTPNVFKTDEYETDVEDDISENYRTKSKNADPNRNKSSSAVLGPNNIDTKSEVKFNSKIQNNLDIASSSKTKSEITSTEEKENIIKYEPAKISLQRRLERSRSRRRKRRRSVLSPEYARVIDSLIKKYSNKSDTETENTEEPKSEESSTDVEQTLNNTPDNPEKSNEISLHNKEDATKTFLGIDNFPINPYYTMEDSPDNYWDIREVDQRIQEEEKFINEQNSSQIFGHTDFSATQDSSSDRFGVYVNQAQDIPEKISETKETLGTPENLVNEMSEPNSNLSGVDLIPEMFQNASSDNFVIPIADTQINQQQNSTTSENISQEIHNSNDFAVEEEKTSETSKTQDTLTTLENPVDEISALKSNISGVVSQNASPDYFLIPPVDTLINEPLNSATSENISQEIHDSNDCAGKEEETTETRDTQEIITTPKNPANEKSNPKIPEMSQNASPHYFMIHPVDTLINQQQNCATSKNINQEFNDPNDFAIEEEKTSKIPETQETLKILENPVNETSEPKSNISDVVATPEMSKNTSLNYFVIPQVSILINEQQNSTTSETINKEFNNLNDFAIEEKTTSESLKTEETLTTTENPVNELLEPNSKSSDVKVILKMSQNTSPDYFMIPSVDTLINEQQNSATSKNINQEFDDSNDFAIKKEKTSESPDIQETLTTSENPVNEKAAPKSNMSRVHVNPKMSQNSFLDYFMISPVDTLINQQQNSAIPENTRQEFDDLNDFAIKDEKTSETCETQHTLTTPENPVNEISEPNSNLSGVEAIPKMSQNAFSGYFVIPPVDTLINEQQNSATSKNINQEYNDLNDFAIKDEKTSETCETQHTLTTPENPVNEISEQNSNSSGVDVIPEMFQNVSPDIINQPQNSATENMNEELNDFKDFAIEEELSKYEEIIYQTNYYEVSELFKEEFEEKTDIILRDEDKAPEQKIKTELLDTIVIDEDVEEESLGVEAPDSKWPASTEIEATNTTIDKNIKSEILNVIAIDEDVEEETSGVEAPDLESPSSSAIDASNVMIDQNIKTDIYDVIVIDEDVEEETLGVEAPNPEWPACSEINAKNSTIDQNNKTEEIIEFIIIDEEVIEEPLESEEKFTEGALENAFSELSFDQKYSQDPDVIVIDDDCLPELKEEPIETEVTALFSDHNNAGDL